MGRDTSTGVVVFHCHCGKQIAGIADDALIVSGVLDAGEAAGMNRRLIYSAPFDRVNQQVKKDCPKCGLDYLTQVRIGAQEVVIYRCTCGYHSSVADIA
jgi:predicted RNA-binding Zn-ribbon protein involved in translation (DUF1610 family)